MSDVARILKEARDQGRLTALDFAQGIFDNFIELHGDRNFRDDGAIIGGIGRLNGQAVTVVGIQKGRNLQDNLNRNFGQPHPEGYRKALRLMKQAEKFGRPVVTLSILQVLILVLGQRNVDKVRQLRVTLWK